MRGRKVEGFRLNDNIIEIRSTKEQNFVFVNGVERFCGTLAECRVYVFDFADNHHNKNLLCAENFEIPTEKSVDDDVQLFVHVIND